MRIFAIPVAHSFINIRYYIRITTMQIRNAKRSSIVQTKHKEKYVDSTTELVLTCALTREKKSKSTH